MKYGSLLQGYGCTETNYLLTKKPVQICGYVQNLRDLILTLYSVRLIFPPQEFCSSMILLSHYCYF